MSDDKKQPPREQPQLLINGREASEREYKRIFGTGKPAASRKDDRATKPLHSVVRGFELMR